MFSYNIKFVEENIATCGLPIHKLPKAMSIFENKKINYIIIDTRNNYDIDAKVEHNNLNKYEEIFEKAHKSIRIKVRVEKIAQELLSSTEDEGSKEKLKKVEEIVYEGRKI